MDADIRSRTNDPRQSSGHPWGVRLVLDVLMEAGGGPVREGKVVAAFLEQGVALDDYSAARTWLERNGWVQLGQLGLSWKETRAWKRNEIR